ncbi:hypothetical protein Bpfe_030676, partial [Biomphalaria pfeifferi]
NSKHDWVGEDVYHSIDASRHFFPALFKVLELLFCKPESQQPRCLSQLRCKFKLSVGLRCPCGELC